MQHIATLKTAEFAIKGWGWFKRQLSGTVTITRPPNQEAHSSEWVKIEGAHSRVSNGKYQFWLMTTDGVEWWLAEDIKLNLNGKWESRVNVGKKSGPRRSVAVVVRVTPVIHVLLTEIRRLRSQTHDYTGIKISQRDRKGWDVVAVVEIQIPGEIKVGETS